MTSTSLSATFVADDVMLIMDSHVDGDQVVSTITDHNGQVLTSLTVPTGTDMDVGADLGPTARAAAEAIAARQNGISYEELLSTYESALDALFAATTKLDRSNVRFALVWHEEVLLRLLPPDPDANTSEDTAWFDALYSLDGNPDELAHTNLIYASHIDAYRPADDSAPKCDLGCSWGDICCYHDEACVWCDHWYCGWSCVPGCFGGDCGGGR